MRFAHAHTLYSRLPMKNKSILPDEGFEPRYVDIGDRGTELVALVWCEPKPAPGVRWGHRIMVKCGCGRDVPFGRMNQHVKACKSQ